MQINKPPRKPRTGKHGGRKRIYPQCPRYRAHIFPPEGHRRAGKCACGYVRPHVDAGE